MSTETVCWALSSKAGSPRLKLVLLLLADGAGMNGELVCDLARVASDAEMSLEEASEAIGHLTSKGLLERCADSEFGLRLTIPRTPALPNLVYGVSPSRWAALRKQVFQRDGWACTYCGSTAPPMHCDHVVPFSKGGDTALENLTTACKICNVSKRARTPNEWRGA